MGIGRTTDLGERRVFAGPEAEVALVKVALERDGIPAVIQWNLTRGRQGGALYVLSERDVARARTVVARFLKGAQTSEAALAAPWKCPSCGEIVEPQFLACWKCGTAKPTG